MNKTKRDFATPTLKNAAAFHGLPKTLFKDHTSGPITQIHLSPLYPRPHFDGKKQEKSRDRVLGL